MALHGGDGADFMCICMLRFTLASLCYFGMPIVTPIFSPPRYGRTLYALLPVTPCASNILYACCALPGCEQFEI